MFEGFSEQAIAVKNELSTYATCDPIGFREEVLPFLGNGSDTARRYLLLLLLKHAHFAEYLADPAQSTTEQAITVAKAAQELGVPLDLPLERIFSDAIRDNQAGPAIIRIIQLFSALSLGKLVLRFQNELLAHPDPRVCSKAVFELVKAGRGPALVAQMLTHPDPRVQANSVEALWGLSDNSTRAVLLLASRSPHNRVAANGILGLYRQAHLDSIPQLLRMASHPNPPHRASALWAIGETGDARFLPFLTREFATSEGKAKLGIVRALSRIRKQIRCVEGDGQVNTTLHESQILSDGSRRIVVALSSPAREIAALSPTQFAVWEQNELVTRYSTRCLAGPPVLILGFAFPRFTSTDDRYAEAVSRALRTCLELKRGADPWCLERYLADEQSRAAVKEQPSLASPDDRSPLALHMKKHRGFLIDPEFIGEVIQEPGRRESASLDVITVIEKLLDMGSRLSGPRHLFIFFDPENALSGARDGALQRLAKSLPEEPVTLHGFAPNSGHDFTALRELCFSSNNGTFESLAIDQMERAVTDTYRALMDRYEIVYRLDPTPPQPGPCELRVSTSAGPALLSFSFGSGSAVN